MTATDPTRFDAARTQLPAQQIVAALPAIEWITDARVERLSQDFYWFSPVLKRQLAHLRADAVARPRSEDEIRAVVAACAQHGVPITVRGSGTGNYGQCMPLHGGVILDLSAYNQLLWRRGGVARAQAGLRLMDMDKKTQPVAEGGGLGWELRCVPSTFRSATLGGLYGGGFGGVGSINHGPLASTGNVLGVRAMSVEPEPRAGTARRRRLAAAPRVRHRRPGKLRGWDQREQIMADVAAGKVVLAAQPRFEAARLVDL